MKTNLKYTFCGYALFFSLVGPVMIASPSKPDEASCSEIPTNECIQKLQTFLKLKSLPFTSNEAELDKLCSNTIAGYKCSATKISIPNCLHPVDKGSLAIFVEMAQYMFQMFCISQDNIPGYRREDLLKNSDCILKQKEALDCCAEKSKLKELPVTHILEQSSKSLKDRQIAACCPIASYLKCAVPIVEKNCGEVAGNLTMEYVRRSSGEAVDSTCQKMPNYPEPNSDFCENPPSVCSGSRIQMFFELITLAFAVFIMRNSYI